MRNPGRRRDSGLGLLAALASLAVLPLGGCLPLVAVNEPLEQHDPNHGYRFTDREQHREPGDTYFTLAFSGGGTRAAAYAYGVLEELRDTEVLVDGVPKSLLDEVDTVSGVSGGSFPAAYYGLFEDRIFQEFEARFLKKNVQRALLLQGLLPWNLVRLLTPWLSRSDLASRYYNKHIFDEATFEDLKQVKGPRVNINATDLSSGSRVTFNQETFDAICSNLDPLPIATAVAASSAVPILLSPITLRNYAGRCNYEPPQWVKDRMNDRDPDVRFNQAMKNFQNFQDTDRKRYIHLVDGASSDNLGLRATIDFLVAAGSAENAREIHGVEIPDRLVVIVVNAQTDPDPRIDLSAAAPSFAALLDAVTGAQIRRYNFETLVLLQDLFKNAARELSTEEKPVEVYLIAVMFDRLEDAEERRNLHRIPTNFALSDEHVDRLRAAGRRLLRESPEFQRLVESFD
jgi:NTE family protein